jgi:hypothetical protein
MLQEVMGVQQVLIKDGEEVANTSTVLRDGQVD